MLHISRRAKIMIALAAIVVGGAVVGRMSISSGKIPSEFQESRLQGALISQTIVNLSNELAGDLERVNQFHAQGNTKDALALTTELFKKSEEGRGQAVSLSNEVGKMTSALSGVKSTEAREAAFESIADRLALITRLVNYSDYLARLLNALHARFAGVGSGRSVEALIQQINAEVTAINNFNRQAGQEIGRFDQIVK